MLRAIALTIFLLALAGAAYIARQIAVERSEPAGSVPIVVGQKRLTLDRAMLRDVALRDGGAVNRLDLVLTWPDFRGAGTMAATTGADLIFVAIEDSALRQRSASEIDPVEQPVLLYSRFLERDAWQNPGGLIMRRFRAGTPYEGEELYLSAPDERNFAARCPRQIRADGLPEDLCLWQTRANGLELQVRFLPRYLVQWQHLAAHVRALTQGVSTRPTK